MNLAEFRINLIQYRSKLRGLLPQDTLCAYNDEEIDVMAFILNTSECLETAMKVATQYRAKRSPTQGKGRNRAGLGEQRVLRY